MPAPATFVIAGGGLAGAKAAEALREQGFDGRIVLVGEEDIRPYERPPLSKDYLQGKTSRDTIFAELPLLNVLGPQVAATRASASSSRSGCHTAGSSPA